MKYNHLTGTRQSYRSVVIIWSLAVVAGVLAWLTLTGAVFGLDVNKSEPMTVIGEQYNPQKTISGYKLQPTVSDAYMQWGDNPQQTAPASVLENTNLRITQVR